MNPIAIKLARYNRIGVPIYVLAALVLLFLYPPTWHRALIFLIIYGLQSFGSAVGYHRYFTHHSFKAIRPFVWFMALCCALAGQGTIRNWVAGHRKHHQFSDKEGDPHSPIVSGFWYSYVGWRFQPSSYNFQKEFPRILAEWPVEVQWLDQAIPFLFLLYPLTLYFLGGWELTEWACLLPTVFLWHMTFLVNAYLHRKEATQTFSTQDSSTTSFWMALLMWGEGWHNHHHAHPQSARVGFKWYEVDLGFWTIWLLSKVGITSKVIQPKR
jgi:fatty-acid desaturase